MWTRCYHVGKILASVEHTCCDRSAVIAAHMVANTLVACDCRSLLAYFEISRIYVYDNLYISFKLLYNYFFLPFSSFLHFFSFVPLSALDLFFSNSVLLFSSLLLFSKCLILSICFLSFFSDFSKTSSILLDYIISSFSMYNLFSCYICYK